MSEVVVDPKDTELQVVPTHQAVVLQEKKPEPVDMEAPDPRDSIEEAAAKKIRDARASAFGDISVPEPEARVKENPIPTNIQQNRDPVTGQFRPKEDEGEPVEVQVEPQQAQPQAQRPKNGVKIFVNGQASEVPADAKVIIKVDGKEQEISVAEAIQNTHLEAAARKRLAQATAAREEAKRILAQAQQSHAAQPQPTTTNARPDPVPAGPTVDEQEALAKEILTAFGSGTEAEILVAMKKLVSQKAASPQLTEAQVREIVARQHEAQVRQETLNRTFQALSQRHQAVFEDERLSAAVAADVTRMMREDLIEEGLDPRAVGMTDPTTLGNLHTQLRGFGRGRDMETIMFTAAERVEQDFLKPNSGQQQQRPATSPATQARLDAKRGAPAPVTATATARPQAKPPVRKTVRDYVEEERLARQS